MSIDISETSYHAAISHSVTLIESGTNSITDMEQNFLKTTLAWVWDTSVSLDLAELYAVNEYTRELIVTLISGRVKFEAPNKHPQAASLERICQNIAGNVELKNPAGNYFKLEEQNSFTPLNRQLSASFIKNVPEIIKIRLLNLKEGRALNHGMPFTQEEKDELIKRRNNGQSIDEISEAFQRSRLSIINRLEELDLLSAQIIQETSSPKDAVNSEESVFCENCGEEIPAGRLRAEPNTLFCVKCKDENENASEKGTVFPPVPQGMRGKCPRCAKGIVVVYQNSTDRNFFLGCSLFPKCRWANDIK